MSYTCREDESIERFASFFFNFKDLKFLMELETKFCELFVCSTYCYAHIPAQDYRVNDKNCTSKFTKNVKLRFQEKGFCISS